MTTSRLERRRVRFWETEAVVYCERVSATCFRVSEIPGLPWPKTKLKLADDDLADDWLFDDVAGVFHKRPPVDIVRGPWFIDDVPAVAVEALPDDGLHSYELQLEDTVPALKPAPKFPPKSGEIAFDIALTKAESHYPVDLPCITETETDWRFPVFQIGCRAVVVNKKTGEARLIGSGDPEQ